MINDKLFQDRQVLEEGYRYIYTKNKSDIPLIEEIAVTDMVGFEIAYPYYMKEK